MTGIEVVEHYHVDGGEGRLAVIVRANAGPVAGPTFLTDPEAGLQCGLVVKKAGETVAPHYHPSKAHYPILAGASFAPEVLCVRAGAATLDLFTSAGEFVTSKKLFPGDVVMLLAGAHGLTADLDLELFEVKAGPYMGAADKTFL